MLCIRVLTRSIGNVANQPAIPAKPPARKSADQGMLLASESISDNSEEWSATPGCADGGFKYRHVASYCNLVVYASSIIITLELGDLTVRKYAPYPVSLSAVAVRPR